MLRQRDCHLQKSFLFATIQCKHPVVCNFPQRLCVIVICAIHTLRLRIRSDSGYGAAFGDQTPQILSQLGIIGNILCQNVHCSLQGCLYIGHLLLRIYKDNCLPFRIHTWLLGKQQPCQRLQTMCTGNACTGLALGAIGSVQIFHLYQGFGSVNGFGKLLRHLVLFGDGDPDLLLAFFQIPQIIQSIEDLPENLIVQRTGTLLPVSGNKGNGCPFIDQSHRLVDLLLAQMKFLCKHLIDVHA